MNDMLKSILTKHGAEQKTRDVGARFGQRAPASQAGAQSSPSPSSPQADLPFVGRCPQCGAHGVGERCPFSTDEQIIAVLAATIVEEFSTRDAKALIRLLCTEGPRIGLEVHEMLNAPEGE